MEREAFTIKIRETISPLKLANQLTVFGYHRIKEVGVVGDFALRGNLVDLWLERYKQPVRIDLIGNKIENIYLFNPLTQAKTNSLKEVYIIPLGLVPQLSQKWLSKEKGSLEKIFFSDVKIGDLVVHIDHGIGSFIGLKDQELIVEYGRGDKLFVPLSQVDRLAKYISAPVHKPKLNFLGTAVWEKTKARVQESVLKLAKELLGVYAKRELVKRKPFEKDTPWQKEFEESFPYQETKDQQQVVKDIKKDLEESKPMDRVLIGDVGFGKTEVAFRAAFKTVQNSYQTAILAPTTVLCEQHLHLLKDRLKNFPVEVGILSRFHKSEKETLEKLKSGAIDIAIGTHRLLSADVHFKNLGLLIIDEEHRFGVKHKEKLKMLKNEVNVLTVSATPIPRTLQMAFGGLREMSVLAQAPLGRESIETVIREYSESLIKEAIEKELERGGQVYYVFNRVDRIMNKAMEIQKLIPEARVTFAHGQMEDSILAKTMESFFSFEADILVCTTIIGSGLDLPNVNTIIIEDAHRFGLADLHQLRGRVGRGERQAYAYLFYPKGYVPQGNVLERLLAISESSELGGGFKLAQRDLEIRGAGNLLGKEQSGNMNVVGFNLYMQLLNQAVEKLKLMGTPL